MKNNYVWECLFRQKSTFCPTVSFKRNRLLGNNNTDYLQKKTNVQYFSFLVKMLQMKKKQASYTTVTLHIFTHARSYTHTHKLHYSLEGTDWREQLLDHYTSLLFSVSLYGSLSPPMLLSFHPFSLAPPPSLLFLPLCKLSIYFSLCLSVWVSLPLTRSVCLSLSLACVVLWSSLQFISVTVCLRHGVDTVSRVYKPPHTHCV